MGDMSDVRMGGVCGEADYTTILNCSNIGSVSCAASDMQMCVMGGVCGETGDVSILNCSNSGAVTCYNASSREPRDMAELKVGGVVGGCVGTIENCFNSGEVSSDCHGSYAEGVGGVCGYSSNSVSNCYYDKDVCPNEGSGTSDDLVPSTGLTTAQCKAATGTDGALVDLLNGYITENPDSTVNWKKWSNKAGSYPKFASPFATPFCIYGGG